MHIYGPKTLCPSQVPPPRTAHGAPLPAPCTPPAAPESPESPAPAQWREVPGAPWERQVDKWINFDILSDIAIIKGSWEAILPSYE